MDRGSCRLVPSTLTLNACRGAAQVVRDTAGGLVRVASWDSNGSEGLGMGDALGAAAAPAAARACESGDEAAPPVKIRRVGAKEILYSRLHPGA